jgi:hypothetical protein
MLNLATSRLSITTIHRVIITESQFKILAQNLISEAEKGNKNQPSTKTKN